MFYVIYRLALRGRLFVVSQGDHLPNTLRCRRSEVRIPPCARCKPIRSLWRDKHPASKGRRPPEHRPGHPTRTRKKLLQVKQEQHTKHSGGNHLPNTTCLAHALFKSGEGFNTLR